MDRETVKISTLKAAPYNPRRISQEAADGLTKSLERWGVVQEVVANRRTGHIVGGHQRVAALKKMGVKEVPVVWVDLDDVEEKALNVALNNPHISGEFDDTIAGLLAEIRDGIGPNDFAELKLDDLLPPDATVTEGNTDPDDVPEVPEEPVTKPGDLWILGNHRLLCGDSTDVLAVERLMDGQKADMVFTSPPYNANAKAGQGDIFNKKKSVKLYADGYSDNLPSQAYVDFAASVLEVCFAVTDGFIFWNVSYNAKSRFEYIQQISGRLSYLVEQICWKKSSTIPFKGSLMRDWEPIYVFSTNKQPVAVKEVTSNFWQVSNTGSQAENHKACFPVELPERGIAIVAKNTGIVFEPFGGSGSTLIACEKTNRDCRMMELDPAYCDVIVKRWEDFTGKKAVLEANDATG